MLFILELQISPIVVVAVIFRKMMSIFSQMSFAKLVWFLIGLNIDTTPIDSMTNISDILGYLLATLKTDNCLQNISIILWFIWKARNDLFFSKRNTGSQSKFVLQLK